MTREDKFVFFKNIIQKEDAFHDLEFDFNRASTEILIAKHFKLLSKSKQDALSALAKELFQQEMDERINYLESIKISTPDTK